MAWFTRLGVVANWRLVLHSAHEVTNGLSVASSWTFWDSSTSKLHLKAYL
jgi:hypothetical protein